MEAERRKARELQSEVARLQRELAARDTDPAGADGDLDEHEDMDTADNSYDTWTEEDRQRQNEVVKGGIPYLEGRFGAESEEVEQARAEVEALQRASREAKPYRTHRGQLERRKARLDAQQERDAEEKEKLQAEIAEANDKLEKIQAAMEDRTKLLEKVDTELKELLRRALAEDGEQPAAATAQPAAPAPKAQAWSMVEATLAELATSVTMPPEQAQQLSNFLGLFRQVATNVLASPGGAALATPPSCGPRWATVAARKPGLNAGTAGAAPASTGSSSGSKEANVSTGVGAGAVAPPQPNPATPPARLPATPTQPPTPAAAADGAGSSSGGNGPSAGLTVLPSLLAPAQPTNPRLHNRFNGTTKPTEQGAGGATRRQRSTSCTRETRRSEAAKAAAAGTATDDAGAGTGAEANPQAGTTVGDQEAAAILGAGDAQMGIGSGGGGAHPGGAAAEVPIGATPVVRIGTEESDMGEPESDIDLSTDDEAAGAADVDMDTREGETEAERRSRIAKFFKQRMQARSRKAKEERRKGAGARQGVRSAFKGD